MILHFSQAATGCSINGSCNRGRSRGEDRRQSRLSRYITDLITLEDGSEVSADLIIAADGAHVCLVILRIKNHITDNPFFMQSVVRP